MEFLAMLYTVLLVAICLMMALLLFRSGRPTGGLDEADCEELKDWLEEQLAAQAREYKQAVIDAIAGGTIQGITGTFTFDEHHNPGKSTAILTYVDGKPELKEMF